MKSAHRRRIPAWAIGTAVIMAVIAGPAQAQQIHRNGFEQKTGWVRSGADAPFDEVAHNISDDAHMGLHSEFLHVNAAKPGTFIHYQYAVGHALVSEEFSASVWIKANRPGIKLLARLVLPNEPDPKFLDSKLTVLLPGMEYANVGRFQQLEIPRPQMLVDNIKRKMQSKEQLGRAVNFTDAYVDALVLNVYSGPGQTQVWIDDLEVGPLSGPVPVAPPVQAAPGVKPRPTRNASIRFNGKDLFVGDRKFFMRGIRQTDAPLSKLRDAGFNTVFLQASPRPELVREGLDLGLWLVPQLSGQDARFVSTDNNLARDVSQFAGNEGMVFWNLGNNLNRQQTEGIAHSMQAIMGMDGGTVFGGDVVDGIQQYSVKQNFLVGTHRWPLFSSLELQGYKDWLEQRRRLAQPGAYLWTWIQTHMPDEYTHLIYNRAGNEAFSEPAGPQAEQIRLMTYLALASGYKGICFWSDRWLALSHHGQDRLLDCAMLNLEMDMLEPILGDETPQWIDTSSADVKAAVLRTARGALVLPIWLGKGSQYVPGQGAVKDLTMTVPLIPQTMQAWHVHPAEIRNLQCERVVGGTKVTIPEFSLTAAVLFTSDNKLVDRLHDQSEFRRQIAAQWAYEQAQYEKNKVAKVHEQLAAHGQVPTESAHLLAEADKRLDDAKEFWNNHNFSESYHESQRALRPLRILMRMHWDRAVRKLDTPVASPCAVSFFSLPRHWEFMEQKEHLIANGNVLPGGHFEPGPIPPHEVWNKEDVINDSVEVAANRVDDVKRQVAKGKMKQEVPHGGKQCAKLEMKPLVGRPAPTVVEKSRIALISPTIKLQPGTLVQVTAWFLLTENIIGSPDGAMFYDSAGGEDLAVRLHESMKTWKKYTLYRRVPASGSIHVTFALTGVGSAYIDDVTIEPLVSATPTVEQPRFGGAIPR